MDVKCYLKVKKLIKPILMFLTNLAGFVTFYFALCPISAYSNIVRTYGMLVFWDLYSKIHLDSGWLSDHFRIEMSRVTGTITSAGSPMERDEFMA